MITQWVNYAARFLRSWCDSKSSTLYSTPNRLAYPWVLEISYFLGVNEMWPMLATWHMMFAELMLNKWVGPAPKCVHLEWHKDNIWYPFWLAAERAQLIIGGFHGKGRKWHTWLIITIWSDLESPRRGHFQGPLEVQTQIYIITISGNLVSLS